MDRLRLDQLLFDRGFFSSKSKAQAEILVGNILVNGNKETKAGKPVKVDSEITIIKKAFDFASRGALKLKGALEDFNISPAGKVCCDLGASTGGFTQILLQNNAKKVYSVDVGYGQLDWKLQNDERVIIMDRTNARFLEKTSFPEDIEFVTGDLSFISLSLIIPAIKRFLVNEGEGVLLIKPQFELDRTKNVKGVVKKTEYIKEAIQKTFSFLLENGFSIKDLSESKITGPKGNHEYPVFIKNSEGKSSSTDELLSRIFLN